MAMESSLDEETSNKVLKQGGFSTEGDGEMVLKQSLVSSTGGAMLELKPKEELDKERAEQEAELTKSKSQSGTNGKNDSEFEPHCQKDLTVPFSLKRSAECLVEAGNTKPANATVGIVESLHSKIGSKSGNIQSEDVVGASERSRAACAVCKHTRRKCGPDCPVAPYFPADKEGDFRNVHKLFGVGRMMKVLQKAKTTTQKEIACKTMITEANIHAQDPVGGCSRIIHDIVREINYDTTELGLIRHKLELYRNSFLLVKDEEQDYLVATQMENTLSKSPEKSAQMEDILSNSPEKLALDSQPKR